MVTDESNNCKMLARVTAVCEETGPLGGVSNVYTVHVRSSDPEEPCKLDYEVGRTFTEFVDAHSKLQKQFSKTAVPMLSKHLSGQNVSCEERMKALDALMTELSSNKDQMNSSVINDFLQIEKNRILLVRQKPMTTPPVKTCLEKEVKTPQKVEKEDEPLNEDFLKEYEAEPERVTIEIGNKNSQKKPSNLGPVAPLRTTLKEESLKSKSSIKDDEEDVDLFLPSKTQSTATDNADIFEEFSTLGTQSKVFTPVKTNLFDEFENDDEDLFKPDERPKEEAEIEEAPPATEKTEPIIRASNKAARINLFEDLDLGDRVFKDEQHLFYIPDKEVEKNEPNVIIDDDEDTKKLLNIDDSMNDIFHMLKVEKENSTSSSTKKFDKPTPPTRTKPQPAPRKTSLNREDSTGEKNNEQSAPSNEKPKPAPKPPVAAKPAKPPKPAAKPPVPSKPMTKKPVPPAKPVVSPKPVKSEKLSHIDINQYISQQASDDNQVNLFG